MVKNLTVSAEKNLKVDKKLIHSIVGKIISDKKFNIENVQINFISSNSMMRINKEYLNHNYSTDIITFDYSGSKKKIEAEIYISVKDAASNAKRYKIPVIEEIARLIIHGFLHLSGFDDRSAESRRIMRKEENRLLNKFRKELNLEMIR